MQHLNLVLLVGPTISEQTGTNGPDRNTILREPELNYAHALSNHSRRTGMPWYPQNLMYFIISSLTFLLNIYNLGCYQSSKHLSNLNAIFCILIY